MAWDRRDYLKIDVEGFERFVLEGARGLIGAGRIGLAHLEMNEHNVVSGLNLHMLGKLLRG